MQNILITGTSRGIGKYLADNLKKDFNLIEIKGKKHCDLSKTENIKNFVNSIGNIVFDAVILNAGVGIFGNFEEHSIEEYEYVINVNLLANIRLLKLLEKNLTKKTKIIFIGSIIGKKFMKGASVYQASKFGLRGFAGGLKTEGKKVFIINPKIVDTDFHKGKITLNPKWERTSLTSILDTVKNILNGKENRFEIDL